MKLTKDHTYHISFLIGRHTHNIDVIYERLEKTLKPYFKNVRISLYSHSSKKAMKVNLMDILVRKEVGNRELLKNFLDLDPYDIEVWIDTKRYVLKDELNDMNQGHKRVSRKRSYKNPENL